MGALRAYEGGRGVVYLLAIVRFFAPSIISMYRLIPVESNSRDWMLTLLLAGAIGGVATAIFLAAHVLGWLIEELDREQMSSTKGKRAALLEALMIARYKSWPARQVPFTLPPKPGQTPALRPIFFGPCC